jgi:Amt family ammonium transporter
MLTVGAAVNGDHGWGLLGTKGFFLSGAGYDARRGGAVPVHDGLHGHRRHHRHRRLRRAVEAEELLPLQHHRGAFIYPVFGCWVWGGGWLAQLGYRLGLGHGAVDYAGSGVVHLQGGALASSPPSSSGRASGSTTRTAR